MQTKPEPVLTTFTAWRKELTAQKAARIRQDKERRKEELARRKFRSAMASDARKGK